jgi:phage terminase large subunit-like protein
MNAKTDDLEEISGATVAAYRKHQKKLHTVGDYNRQFAKYLDYVPHPKKLRLHQTQAHKVAVITGNQQGKTHSVGAQIMLDATGLYTDAAFYTGPRLRDGDAIIWAASTTQQMSKVGVQRKLLGDIERPNGLGTGLIPLSHIVSYTKSRGVSELVDTATIVRPGGYALVRVKTYMQGRAGFQTESVDRVWLDEDPGHDESVRGIWGEVLARLTATNGRVYFSATAAEGRTEIVKYFLDRSNAGDADVTVIRAGIEDATHIPKADWPRIISQYPSNEVACRVHGEIMIGEGRIFDFDPREAVYDLVA